MTTRKTINRNKPGKNILFFLNLTMGTAYLGCGSFLVISPSAGKIMPSEYITGVSICLMVYGAFRLYRTYLQWKNPSIL